MLNNEDLSIVVPIGPGENAWRGLLNELTSFGPGLEVILAACEPRLPQLDLAEHVHWIYTRQGRARQMNAGAQHASRSVIWFLHADSRLTADTQKALQSFIADTSTVGYFRLQFAADGPGLTYLNAWAANFRSRYLRLPFGDQGLIMRRKLFWQMSGYDEKVSPGEDLDFVVRLCSSGYRLQELPAMLMTSARKYRRFGWWNTTSRHIWLTWLLSRQAKRRINT